jgi:hypothetical protein
VQQNYEPSSAKPNLTIQRSQGILRRSCNTMYVHVQLPDVQRGLCTVNRCDN